MDRLNLQHYLWKDQTGYLLHPSISLSGAENLRIADVGTGTGYVNHHPYYVRHHRACCVRVRKCGCIVHGLHHTMLSLLSFTSKIKIKNGNQQSK